MNKQIALGALIAICIAFEVGQLLDVITTNIALGFDGTYESNPLFKGARRVHIVMVIVKLSLPVILLAMVASLVEYPGRFIFLTFLTAILTCVSFVVVINNAVIITRCLS